MSDQVPRLRYSAIACADSCLLKYQKQYLLNQQSHDDGIESIDTRFGTALHLGLQAFLEGDDGIKVFELYWSVYKEATFIQSRFNHGQLQELGKKFLGRFERLHLKRFQPHKIEYHFENVEIGGIFFDGTADYIGGFDSIPTILDFKTANKAYANEKIVVMEQLPIYTHLAKKYLNFDAVQVAYMVFVKGELRIQTLTHQVTKPWLDGHIRNVIMKGNGLLNRTEFPRNPSSCVMGSYKCGFYSQCHGEKAE